MGRRQPIQGFVHHQRSRQLRELLSKGQLVYSEAAGSAAARTTLLNRGTGHCAIRAINAAVSLLWFQDGAAALAVVKPLTCISRHALSFLVTAFGAGDLGDNFDPRLVDHRS